MLCLFGSTKNDDRIACLQAIKMPAASPESSPVGFRFNEAEINNYCGISLKLFCCQGPVAQSKAD